MNWWLRGCGLLLAAALLIGCSERNDETERSPTASVPVFSYDAARDVVLANSVPVSTTPPLTADDYAGVLAAQSQVTFAPSPDLQLSYPQVKVADDLLTVNYRRAVNLERLAAAQIAAVQAAWEGWWWVPGIRRVRVEAAGQPLAQLGQLVLEQPMRPTWHTYVWHPTPGEVGYLIGVTPLTDLAAAVAALRQREVTEFAATQGFLPLLPPDVTMTVAVEKLAGGILPVDFSDTFPREEVFRLAGIILMLTQFPEVEAVQVTFDGKVVDQPFMLGNLKAPVSPAQLLLPVLVARPAIGNALEPLRAAVAARLGRPAAAYGAALLWRDWATLSVIPQAGAPTETWLLRQDAQGYAVQLTGARLTAAQLSAARIPREVIVAFRLDGWESQVQVQP